MSDTLTAALDLHAAGYCPIRVTTDGAKQPLGRWKHYQTQRPTEGQVRAWFANGYPGIGIVTGAASGNAEMLEFEGRAIREGVFAAWGDLMDASGLGDIKAKLVGYADWTPKGGIHLHYRVDGRAVPGNTKLARRPSNAEELAANPDDKVQTLIETRGEGGFVVTAPSNGTTHNTGKPWKRASGGPRTTPVLTVDEHDALMTACRALDQMPEPAAEPNPFTKPARGDNDVLRPGDDYNRRARWEDILTGWTKVCTAGTTSHWRRPGKRVGTSATTGRNDADNLYVFSSSTEFDPEKPYSKFAAYTLLHHRGDWSAAARQLAADGYGEQRQRTSSNHHDQDTTVDDTGFWNARPVLQHLHDFAKARMVSPWAVLGSALAKVCTAVPPFVVLPPIIGGDASLNTYVGLVGESGDGKDSAIRVGFEAIDVPGDPLAGGIEVVGVGSGEGVAHQYVVYRKPKGDDEGGLEQIREAVCFTAPEVDTLTAMRNRQASTLLPELRKAWNGDALGFSYVDKEKRLKVPAHKYRLCLIVGIQPERAASILDDADAGTPQRFLWLPTDDPDVADELPDAPTSPVVWKLPKWPIAINGRVRLGVCTTARDTIVNNRKAQLRRDGHRLDGHALLCRLKVAGLFAVLDNHADITDADWTLAGIVAAKSEHTRNHVVRVLEDANKKRNTAQALAESDRGLLIEDRRDSHHVRRVASRLDRKIPDDWTPGSVLRRDGCAYRDRQYFDEAVDHLVEAGRWDRKPAENDGPDGWLYRRSAEAS